jgi:hypothetical protein
VPPDQRPALQFSGDQYFSNLWSCVHLFDFPPAELSEAQYRDVSNLSAAELRATFCSNDGNCVCPANWLDLPESPKPCSTKRI